MARAGAYSGSAGRRGPVKNGRPEPEQPKKRPERAAGGPPRRASSGSGGGRARTEGARPEREARPGRKDRKEGPGRPDRETRTGEPGFGPFRGKQRPAVGPDRRRAGAGEERDRPGDRRKRRDDEARTVRSVAEEAVARASGEPRPALRIVHGSDAGDRSRKPKRDPAGKGRAARKAAAGAPAAPRPKPVRDGGRLQEAIVRGARALDRGYEREALRILRPYRDPHPDSADLRELLGLTYYRLGRWSLARKELEAFVALTGSTEQHPVLMDCARALGRFARVESLWAELRAASPTAAVVTEGRIVAAGALADRGLLD